MNALEAKEARKIADKQRRAIKATGDKLRMWFGINRIKTWRDAYTVVGYTQTYFMEKYSNVNEVVDKPGLEKFIKSLEDELEAKLCPPVEPVHPVTEALNETAKVSFENGANLCMYIPPTAGLDTTVRNSLQLDAKTDESGYTNDNDYGLVESPKEKAFLYYFQKKAAAEVLEKVVKKKYRAVLVIARTGTGKTFIQGAIDRRLKDMVFEKDKTWGVTNYLAITRNSVVEQTKRVLQEQFGIIHPSETEVINIEQLRARAGQMWVKCKGVIIDGQASEVWEWKPMINPVVLFLDECQAVKNEDSTQHKIITAFSKIESPTAQVFISATPFTRVSEAKSFAIATRKDISHITGIPGSVLNEATWPTYAAMITDPTGMGKFTPSDYNEEAVERLMKDLDDYIVRVKGVRWQFDALNKTEVIDFAPPSEANDFTDTEHEYALAWQTYLNEMARLEKEVTDNPCFQALVKLMKFLIAAEYAKRYIFAERMYRDVQSGHAAVLACKNKKTIIAVVKILNEKYGVPRNKISLIWGGGQTAMTAKQKLKAAISAKKELFEEQGITMEDLQLDEVEDRIMEDLPEELRLGNQSKEERQKEMDRFQAGISLYCVYTFKAGGVGVSTHHTDEQTNRWDESVPGYAQWQEEIKRWNRNKPEAKRVKPGKVRKQSNGYAYVEDIPFIPTRPRKTTVSPTWSPIELVQGVGRCPRLTSLSNTEQTLIGFRGTVEEDQLFVVTHRLKCLSKVVRQKENWQDLIIKHKESKEIARKLVEESGLTEDSTTEKEDINETNEQEE